MKTDVLKTVKNVGLKYGTYHWIAPVDESIVILKTQIWKPMKRYCCMFFIMFSLSACARSSVQDTWENQTWITAASFNTVLANQSNRAQSFLANSNKPPT